MNVIKNIREARIAKKVSQATLAESIGMSTEGYNRLENRGGDKITIEQLEKIADALKVPVLELLGVSLETEILRKDVGEVKPYFLERYNAMIDHSQYCFELFDKWLKKNKKASFELLSLSDEDENEEYTELDSIVNALKSQPELRLIFFALIGLSVPAYVSNVESIFGRLAPYSPEEKNLLQRYLKENFNMYNTAISFSDNS